MYYSLPYIKSEETAFSKIGKTTLFGRKVIKKLLELEGEFILDISKILKKQTDRFPYGIIKDFLSVYPQLRKARYRLEKEFLLRELNQEEYLITAQENEIDVFFEYYEEGYNLGGETSLNDIKNVLIANGGNLAKLGNGVRTIFTLIDPVVRNKLKWEAGKRIVGINNTSRRLIINTILGAYDRGEGYDGIKKELKNLFSSWQAKPSGQKFTKKRAEVIARTELGQAVSWAREESYARRDVRRKSWLAEPNACPICVLAMNDGVISFSMTFSNGYLGPLAHPQCRCSLLPEVEIQDYLKGYTWHGEAQNAQHTQT
jgi:hypothetical protein